MVSFLTKLLKTALELPDDMELGIARVHRALVAKPTGAQAKPQSIVAKFESHWMKEEILRRAWQKKELLCNSIRFYIDHDYPPEVLKQRAEYAKAEKVLKEKQIKLQTPYSAKMRVFYADGTKLYQNAADAMRDIAKRGIPVKVVKTLPTFDQQMVTWLQLLLTWESAGRRGVGDCS